MSNSSSGYCLIDPFLLASRYCAEGSLDRAAFVGTIVACRFDPSVTVSGPAEVLAAGGAGIILVGTPSGTRQYPLPATYVTPEAAALSNTYFKNTL